MKKICQSQNKTSKNIYIYDKDNIEQGHENKNFEKMWTRRKKYLATVVDARVGRTSKKQNEFFFLHFWRTNTKKQNINTSSLFFCRKKKKMRKSKINIKIFYLFKRGILWRESEREIFLFHLRHMFIILLILYILFLKSETRERRIWYQYRGLTTLLTVAKPIKVLANTRQNHNFWCFNFL